MRLGSLPRGAVDLRVPGDELASRPRVIISRRIALTSPETCHHNVVQNGRPSTPADLITTASSTTLLITSTGRRPRCAPFRSPRGNGKTG